jgi:hypothetical protein
MHARQLRTIVGCCLPSRASAWRMGVAIVADPLTFGSRPPTKGTAHEPGPHTLPRSATAVSASDTVGPIADIEAGCSGPPNDWFTGCAPPTPPPYHHLRPRRAVCRRRDGYKARISTPPNPAVGRGSPATVPKVARHYTVPPGRMPLTWFGGEGCRIPQWHGASPPSVLVSSRPSPHRPPCPRHPHTEQHTRPPSPEACLVRAARRELYLCSRFTLLPMSPVAHVGTHEAPNAVNVGAGPRRCPVSAP